MIAEVALGREHRQRLGIKILACAPDVSSTDEPRLTLRRAPINHKPVHGEKTLLKCAKYDQKTSDLTLVFPEERVVVNYGRRAPPVVEQGRYDQSLPVT